MCPDPAASHPTRSRRPLARERTAHGLRIALALALLVALGAPSRAATVDDSTVRVFAIGTVSADPIVLQGRRVTLANALAGHGSGFIVEGGLVMTAHHVIDQARHVVVRLPGKGGFFAARVVYDDKAADIALLSLGTDPSQLPAPLALGAQEPRVRGTVFAVGYPIDAARTHPQSAQGIIAGFLDDGTVQLDMTLNPGNSGGPVVDEHDVVVGMAVARGALDRGVQGIGYAVPVAKLAAALAEARRRLRAGEVDTTTTLSRDSALVVDELVQHGALYELKKNAPANAGGLSADLEQAVAALIARVHDPDLLMFVSGTLWDVSIALEYASASQLPASITHDQALALAARLRNSATTAARRAVELDPTVGQRSSFVWVALGGGGPPGTAPPQAPGAPGGAPTAWANASSLPPPMSRPHLGLKLRVAPMARVNPASGTVGFGYGGAVELAFASWGRSLRPVVGAAVQTVSVPGAGDESFQHLILAADVGLIARFGKLDVTGEIGACIYHSTVENAATPGAAQAVAASLRFAAGYRFGWLEVGAGVRALSGPTFWFEPATLSVVF